MRRTVVLLWNKTWSGNALRTKEDNVYFPKDLYIHLSCGWVLTEG